MRRALALSVFLSLAGLGSCGGESPMAPTSSSPQLGAISVSTSTTGNNPDPDGYTVSLDGGAGRQLGINSSVTFPDLSAGDHTVQLTGLAAGCQPAGNNPRNVAVTSGATVQTTFNVNCPGASISGTVTVVSGLLSMFPDMAMLHSVPSQPSARRPTTVQYVPNELIVTFDGGRLGTPPRGSRALSNVATSRQVAHLMRLELASLVNSGVIDLGIPLSAALSIQVRVSSDLRLADIVRELEALPSVRSVRRSTFSSLVSSAGTSASAPEVKPTDPAYPRQTWHYRMMDLPKAWGITTGSPAVVVAVVDDGITFHPDIASNLTSDGYDFVSNTAESLCGGGTIGIAGDGDGPDPDPTKPSAYEFDELLACVQLIPQAFGNHGLFVSGLIGAVANNGVGGTGVSWNVRIRPVRVADIVGRIGVFDAAVGIVYAAGGAINLPDGSTIQVPAADIINLSLGFAVDDPLLAAAIAFAEQQGVVVVAAAGNDGTATDNYPAAYPTVLSVGALSPAFTRTLYSNFPPSVDVWAPGGEVSFGLDFGVFSTSANYATNVFEEVYSQGTSFAAPHVAGLAALILSQTPSLAPSQVRSRILDYSLSNSAGKIANARNSLTQTLAPARNLFVQLVDATTGSTLQTNSADAAGAYSFVDLSPGSYFVYAGEDEDADGQIGVPVRRWGAHGGSATPALVVVGTSNVTVSFQIGGPNEVEPNDDLGSLNVLQVGGYSIGTLLNGTDVDVFRVQIPQTGTYTVETQGVFGACGFALDVDTFIRVLASSGAQIGSNGDVNPSANDLCSRITLNLNAGTNYVAVEPSAADTGYYSVSIRAGP